MKSNKTTDTHSQIAECKKSAIPGEGKASEPTIIAEQHRTANIGPQSVKDSQSKNSRNLTPAKEPKNDLSK